MLYDLTHFLAAPICIEVLLFKTFVNKTTIDICYIYIFYVSDPKFCSLYHYFTIVKHCDTIFN